MKKLLDEVFCQYAVENQLLEEEIVAFQSQYKNIMTTREALLLKGYLSLETYNFILSKLNLADLSEATDSEVEFDQKFLDYGLKKAWIAPGQLEKCDRPSRGSLTQREYLLTSRTISYDVYRDIMMALISSPAKADISAETVIDKAAGEPLPTDKITEPLPTDKTTIIDTPIRKMAQNSATTPHNGMPAVRDESAETIVDMNPLEPGEDGHETSSLRDRETNTDTASCVGTGHGVVSQIEARLDKMVEIKDESAETMVDMNPLESQGPLESVSPYQRESLNDKALSSNDESAETLIDQCIETAAPVCETPTATKGDPEATVEIPFNPSLTPPGKERKIREERPTGRYFDDDFSVSNQVLSDDSPRWDAQESEVSDRLLTTPLVKTLVREITREVNLQTQQISHTVGERLSSYRILMGMAIFVALFLLIFAGITEWYRMKELEKVREERGRAVNAREGLLAEREVLLKERLAALTALENLQNSLHNLSMEKRNIEEAMRDREAETRSEKDRLENALASAGEERQAVEETLTRVREESDRKVAELQKRCEDLEEKLKENSKAEDARMRAWLAMSYQKLGDEKRADREIKKALAGAGQDIEVLLMIAKYWQNAGDYEQALQVLKVPENFKSPDLWQLHAARANLYFLSDKKKEGYEEWENARKLKPELKNLKK